MCLIMYMGDMCLYMFAYIWKSKTDIEFSSWVVPYILYLFRVPTEPEACWFA